MDKKVILLHGFGDEDLLAAVRAVKAALPDSENIAFAAATPTNLEWKVRELVEHVSEEHEEWKKRGG